MAEKTGIEWTDATWTPLRTRVKPDAGAIAKAKGYTSLVRIATSMAGHVGPHCEHVSGGCDHCYSERNNGRCMPNNGTGLPFDRRARDLVDPFVDEKILRQPLKWRKPHMVFVCSQTDLFGEWVTDEDIDRVFAVMASCPQHTFQVLTKRPERMLAYLNRCTELEKMCEVVPQLVAEGLMPPPKERERLRWPLPNVVAMTSVEDEETAQLRIPILLQTPAALHGASYEPALGPVDFAPYLDTASIGQGRPPKFGSFLDWVIVGGESGPGARPAHPDWFRSVRDHCQAAGVAFFFKQWGEWAPCDQLTDVEVETRRGPVQSEVIAPNGFPTVRAVTCWRIGKRAAGALLDDKEWKQFPEARA